MRYHSILLFGAPGSGKGTQGHILGNIPGFVHVACGDVFRNLRVGSELGRVFLDYSGRGELVPDQFSVQLWKEHIEGMISLHQYDPGADILILDGIPRNVEQSVMMDEHIDVLRVYYLDCDDRDIMYMRLKRRALHENRLDDASDDVIQERLNVYTAETMPVLNHYDKNTIRRIDTGRLPVEVLTDILVDLKAVAAGVAEEEHELPSNKVGPNRLKALLPKIA